MAMFQQYQGGIAPVQGITEAGARIGQMAQIGMQDFGKSLGEGLKAYNDNVAKDSILTEEAKVLGSQIQQYAQMFGNSPEHAEFTKSLQPYIDQLAKVPSQSLTQKMGTVTGVKAGFANIGQQLQAFEVMRSEKLKRDYYDAKNVTPSTEIVVDPVAIAKGQAPWDDRKTYDQNIAGFRTIAQQAVDKTGAAIDIDKATQLYKESIKRSLRTGVDSTGRPINPDILNALNDQVAAGEKYDELAKPLAEFSLEGYGMDFSPVSDYESLTMSAKDVAKTRLTKEAEANKPAPDTIEKWRGEYEIARKAHDTLAGKAIDWDSFKKAKEEHSRLSSENITLHQEALAKWKSDTEFRNKEKEGIPAQIDAERKRIEEFTKISDSLPRLIYNKDGTQVINPEFSKAEKQVSDAKKRIDNLTKRRDYLKEEETYPVPAPQRKQYREPKPDDFKTQADTTPNAPANLAFYADKMKNADKQIKRLSIVESAKKELDLLPKRLAELDKKIENEEGVEQGWFDRLTNSMTEVLDPVNVEGVKGLFRMSMFGGKAEGAPDVEVTTESITAYLEKIDENDDGAFAVLGGAIIPDPFGNLPKLTKAQNKLIESTYKEYMSKKRMSEFEGNTDPQAIKDKLLERKRVLESQIATGKLAPTEAEKNASAQQAKEQQTRKTQFNAPTLVGVDKNLGIGTSKREVKMSVDKQETAMAGFFQKKYGYVPAGFSETFKANTPEANFKTMETPYGAFMWDGKTWNQLKGATPMSAKDIGENAAYNFSSPDGRPKEFANSGIYLSGNFEGTSTELAKFRIEYRSLAHAEKSIARLQEINDMTGESMSPSLRGEARALLPAIKAALRTEIIGVGTVSNYEQELINDVVAGATDFFSLEESDRAKLLVIMERVRDSIANVPAIYGLTVHRTGNTANVESALRQKLMNSGGTSKREQDFNAKNSK